MMIAVRIACLTAIWLALWSDVSVANVLSGVVVGSLVVATFGGSPRGRPTVRPVAVVKLTLYFSYQLFASTVVVARTVISPSGRVRTGIVAVPLTGCSDAVVTLIADAISLTPGTLAVEVRRDPLTLYVHALDVRDVSVLRDQLRRLEVLAIRAFGDDAAIAGLSTDDSRAWTGR